MKKKGVTREEMEKGEWGGRRWMWSKSKKIMDRTR